jgi:hypothetical protein
MCLLVLCMQIVCVCDCLWRVFPFLFVGHCSQTAACEYKETITDTSDSVVALFCILAFLLCLCVDQSCIFMFLLIV